MSVILEQTEKEWAAEVSGLAKMLGWRRYHTHDSRRSAHGFPDEVYVRERVIFAELKREKTKPTEQQVEWLDDLAHAGQEVYLLRPSDLEELGLILGHRWLLDREKHALSRWLRNGAEWMTPNSLWIAGKGRRDST